MKNITRDWLIEHYQQQGLSCWACGEKVGVDPMTIHRALRRFGLLARSATEHMHDGRSWRKGHPLTDETKARIAQAKTGVPRSQQSRQKQADSITGPRNHRYGKPRGHGLGAWVVLADGQRIYMRSRWEVLFADWLQSRGHTWCYEPEAFTLADGSCYTPDFLSESTGVYYEVKGWLNDADRAKIEAFRRDFPDKPLVVMDKPALIALGVAVCDRNIIPAHITVSGPRMGTCPGCGRTFIKATRGTVYCGTACNARKPKKAPAFIICAVCGKQTRVYPSAVGRRKTCSRACGTILGAQARSGERHWSRCR